MSQQQEELNLSWLLLFSAWLVSLIATLGSLFFSEVMEFVPCSLCWYQRICMYPLVAVLGVGLFPLDRKVFKFSFPLVITGLIISIYHILLQLEIIPENMSPCVEGIPCSGTYLNWLGFITIPMLSFFAFALILTALVFFFRRENK